MLALGDWQIEPTKEYTCGVKRCVVMAEWFKGIIMYQYKPEQAYSRYTGGFG